MRHSCGKIIQKLRASFATKRRFYAKASDVGYDVGYHSLFMESQLGGGVKGDLVFPQGLLKAVDLNQLKGGSNTQWQQ